MKMVFLIDTNVLIDIENKDVVTLSKMNKLFGQFDAAISISILTYAEFYYGFMDKTKEQQKMALKQLSQYVLFAISDKTAIIFCEILYDLKKRGKMIQHFDIMIAAIAVEHNLILITKDNDFEHINILKKIILENK